VALERNKMRAAEREREREREIRTICARLDLVPKRNKKQIKRDRLRFESKRRCGESNSREW
jgi:hypothetical protein